MRDIFNFKREDLGTAIPVVLSSTLFLFAGALGLTYMTGSSVTHVVASGALYSALSILFLYCVALLRGWNKGVTFFNPLKQPLEIFKSAAIFTGVIVLGNYMADIAGFTLT
jgi:hypothetical protein